MDEPEKYDDLAEEAVLLGLPRDATLKQVQLARVNLVWTEDNLFRLAGLAGALQ